jgi:hypothetical protein
MIICPVVGAYSGFGVDYLASNKCCPAVFVQIHNVEIPLFFNSESRFMLIEITSTL